MTAQDPFYVADKARLKALAGRRCPLCGEGLRYTGVALACRNAHGWSNPGVAESEIL